MQLEQHLASLRLNIYKKRLLSIILIVAILASICLIARFGLLDILIFGPTAFMSGWCLLVNLRLTHELIGKLKQAEAIGHTADNMARIRKEKKNGVS